MLSKWLVATAVFATSAGALAQPAAPVVTVHDIGLFSANPLLSGNNVGLDVHVALDGAAWLTGGMNGTAHFGSFRYALDGNNSVRLSNTRPFDASDEVTMVSKPRNQTAGRRFKAHGAISHIPLGYQPVLPLRTDGANLNVGFLNDFGDFTETRDGYIMRIVVDLTGTGIEVGAVYAVAGTTPTGAGHLRIADGRVGAGAVDHPDALDRDQSTRWSIWAVEYPEPGSLALLVLGSLAACRRR